MPRFPILTFVAMGESGSTFSFFFGLSLTGVY